MLYAPFLIAAEFTIKNNIRQIKMINIELKSMEMKKKQNNSVVIMQNRLCGIEHMYLEPNYNGRDSVF